MVVVVEGLAKSNYDSFGFYRGNSIPSGRCVFRLWVFKGLRWSQIRSLVFMLVSLKNGSANKAAPLSSNYGNERPSLPQNWAAVPPLSHFSM